MCGAFSAVANARAKHIACLSATACFAAPGRVNEWRNGWNLHRLLPLEAPLLRVIIRLPFRRPRTARLAPGRVRRSNGTSAVLLLVARIQYQLIDPLHECRGIIELSALSENRLIQEHGSPVVKPFVLSLELQYKRMIRIDLEDRFGIRHMLAGGLVHPSPARLDCF
jgi:hypothetical protein